VVRWLVVRFGNIPGLQKNESTVKKFPGENSLTSKRITNLNPMTGYRKTYKKKKGVNVRKYATKRYGKMRVTRGVTMAPEVKHFEMIQNANNSGNPTAFGNTAGAHGDWTLMPLPCCPTQGTDFTNRIGRKIRMLRMEFAMVLGVNTMAAIGANGDTVICEFFMDNECKGAAPSSSDIFVPAYTTNNPSVQIRNASNLKRFKSLGGMKHDVIPTSIVSGAVASVSIPIQRKIVIPLNKEVNFVTNTGTITDIVDNLPLLCCTMAWGANGAWPLNMVATYRIWYIDI